MHEPPQMWVCAPARKAGGKPVWLRVPVPAPAPAPSSAKNALVNSPPPGAGDETPWFGNVAVVYSEGAARGGRKSKGKGIGMGWGRRFGRRWRR